MKSFIYIALLVLIPCISKAQPNYFVYIQTDNKQPFYIKMNDKLLSSSSSGYIVIPKLSNGTYNLNVGFPKDQWPQQNLALVMNGSDAGYLLKNFAEKGWGLYNIQTMQITMNGQPTVTPVKPTLDNDDVFANTLSGATNSNLSIKKDVVPIPATIPVKLAQKTIANTVKKLESINDTDGKTFIYTDNNTDTIKIFFPQEALQQSNYNNSEALKKDIPVTQSSVTTAPTTDKRFLDINLQNPNATNNVVNPPISAQQTVAINKENKQLENNKIEAAKSTPVVSINSDCKATATDDDFFKLRKKMAASSNDDDLIKTANKYFKSKCFSVSQIKNLSALFLTDNGKYKFFDAAYSHVYDSQNFESLKAELTDAYFIKRFSDMLGK